MIVQALLLGFFWGFLLCFTFGPAFFALVQISIDSNYKKGMALAGGVVAADAILMFFAIFGTSLLPQIKNSNEIITALGSIILLGMGLLSFFNKQKQIIYPKSKIGNFLYFFTKGLVLNLLNPANFLFVVSTCAYLKGALRYDLIEIIYFMSASLLATFVAEVLISIYASKIKKLTDKNVINLINKAAGILFISVALKMLYKQFLS